VKSYRVGGAQVYFAAMRRSLVAMLTAAVVSCSRPPPDATPEGSIREWVERMEAQQADPETARQAYALLSRGTQAQLEKRAERSSRIEGHRVEPYDVLAPGRFALKFEPRAFKAQVSGETATVDVVGEEPSEVAVMHCVKEGVGWRVVLDLPDLEELPRRPGARE
jgi:hypothetical protein